MFIENVKTNLSNFIPEMQIQNSGWVFSKILNIIVSISKYQPLRGGSYLPLPEILTNKKCCINIKNEDNECLKYCVLYFD